MTVIGPHELKVNKVVNVGPVGPSNPLQRFKTATRGQNFTINANYFVFARIEYPDICFSENDFLRE